MSESIAMRSTSLKTPRTRLKRLPKRGAHDFATIASILDAGFFCHVGFVAGGQPYVIPTGYGRKGRTLYIHGSFASRMLNELAAGIPMCLTVTIVDGLVLARSGFHSSVNYRSAVVLGTAREVAGGEKAAALEIISEHILPGRWADIRWPNRKELKATIVLKLTISEASAKIRTGPPLDDEEDYALKCWAGVLPLRLVPGEPIPDPRLPQGIAAPDYARKFPRPRAKK
ncbi:MAG TPA: pyridoxamine 5'-phosphate oxidase family protein [Burkholderiales bacterium]|nr:pyridoxamine 5'-phosphate oxidase family protein [Burkholderiales bacterium]